MLLRVKDLETAKRVKLTSWELFCDSLGDPPQSQFGNKYNYCQADGS
jgi:hypothetical protein